jgi:hypothetical protein
MPVVPSFTGYGPKASAAEAYSAGARTRLGYAQIAQQAQEAAARIALGREQLQQQAVQNEMELAAKKEALSNEALRRAQEQEIEKAYRQTQLGLRERELAGQEAMNALKIQEAARDFDRMQGYQRRYKELTGQKMSPEEAAIQATLELGGTGLSTAIQQTREPSNVPQLNLQNRIIQQQKEDLLRPYKVAGMDLEPPPQVQAQLDELSRRQAELIKPLAPPSTMTGTNVPALGPTTVATPTVTTKAQFDALPKGAEYISKSGKRYRKP